MTRSCGSTQRVPMESVITSGASDPGSCVRYQHRQCKRKHRFLASLGMTARLSRKVFELRLAGCLLCGIQRGRLLYCRAMLCVTLLRAGGFRGNCLPFCQLLAIEITNDARDVSLRLIIWRNAVILFDAPRAGVVCGESFDQIKIVALE